MKMHLRHRYFTGESGLSLVELMVALGMLALVSVGVMLGQLQSNRLAGKARSINSAKVVLRQMIDRFQTVAKGDPLLSASTAFSSDANLGLTDMDANKTGVQVVLFDSDPSANGGTGAAGKLYGTIERKVTYPSGTPTSESALANATFKITFTVFSKDTVLDMSTNRATP